MRVKHIRDDYYGTGPDPDHNNEYRVIKVTEMGIVKGERSPITWEPIGWARDASTHEVAAIIQAYEDSL